MIQKEFNKRVTPMSNEQLRDATINISERHFTHSLAVREGSGWSR